MVVVGTKGPDIGDLSEKSIDASQASGAQASEDSHTDRPRVRCPLLWCLIGFNGLKTVIDHES